MEEIEMILIMGSLGLLLLVGVVFWQLIDPFQPIAIYLYIKYLLEYITIKEPHDKTDDIIGLLSDYEDKGE